MAENDKTWITQTVYPEQVEIALNRLDSDGYEIMFVNQFTSVEEIRGHEHHQAGYRIIAKRKSP